MGLTLMLDRHNMAIHGGFSATAPVRPSGSAAGGWILMPLGLSVKERAERTSLFLDGGAAAVTGCYGLCAGVNHAWGGSTAIEVGVGLGVGGRPVLSNGGALSTGYTGKVSDIGGESN